MIHLDIEWKELQRIGDMLGASEKQIKYSLARALRRTASALRVMSSKGLKTELGLRRANALRKRLKSVKLTKRGGIAGVQLWYGLNDMPISWFKGRPTQTATGASFRGVNYPGAFVANSTFTNTKTIFKRKGTSRLHIEEQLLPVKNKADVFVEDEIFIHAETILWPLFKRELAARVKYNIGAK